MYPFAPGNYAPSNAWYVAAFSDEIGQHPIERWILDEPLVMFRKLDGSPAALAGRCPHRQYPMVEARRNGDVLVCGYHGISFDADGKCQNVPSQPKAPRALCLRSYPLVEKWRWIWIWPGDPALADPSLIPDHDAIALQPAKSTAGNISVPLFHHEIEGRYQFLNDNLLDLTHLAFLHSSNFGMEENATTRDEVTVGDGWLRSKREINNAGASPWYRRDFGVTQVDNVVDFTYYLPGLHVGQNLTKVADPGESQGNVLQDTTVYHAITPARRRTSHYFFATTVRTPIIREDEIGPMRDGIAQIIKEDIYATEVMERIVGDREDLRDVMTGGDEAVVRGRRMLEAMMLRERPDQ